MQVSDDTRIGLYLPALSRPLVFERCPGLARAFAGILSGWDAKEASGAQAEPIGVVRRVRDGYRWIPGAMPAPEGWEDDPPATAMEALCDLHFELIEWFLDAHPSHLCMHCAAARIGNALVVFPSPRRAGKSTLALQLAAAGHRIFGDDVLPLESARNHGFALGLAPRVRLPLPRGAGAGLRAFLAARAGPKDRSYQYADLAEAELAPLGETAPVAGLVLLERRASGPARLEPVARGEMLKRIIRRNFADGAPAPALFDRLDAVAAGARRLSLSYTDGGEAVRLLEREFAAGGRTPARAS